MKKLLSTCYAATLLILFGWNCSKNDLRDIKIPANDAEYAFPLFTTTLAVNDLVDQILSTDATGDTIIVNADQSITLIYSGDVVESKATEIFPFFAGGLPIPIPDSTAVVPLNPPNGITIKKVDFKSGELAVGFINTFNEPIYVTFTMPQLSKNGVVFSADYVVDVNPAPVFPVYAPKIQMTGWTLLANPAAPNAITFNYKARKADGTPVVFPPSPLGGLPGCVAAFNALQFSYLEGYWGAVEYSLTTDTIDIDINQTNLTGGVKIKNPRVTITLLNSFGFPTRGLVKILKFRSKTGEEIPLISPLINTGGNNGIDFDYPSLADGEVGQTKSTSFSFDNTNSNIEDIFNLQPTQMIYNVFGLANAEQDPNLIGFLTDSSSVKLNVKVELQLEGSLQDFSADQTLPLNFGDYGNSNLDSTDFESVEFKLVADNGIPLTMNMQVYFQDENGVVLDSLFATGKNDLLLGATKDVNGSDYWFPTHTETFIPMSAARFNAIRQKTRKAFLDTTISTTNGGTEPVKILAYQSASVRMGVRVKTRL